MICYFKFNHLQCPTDKINVDEIFADRFRFQLTTFEMYVLMWISQLSCSDCKLNNYFQNYSRNLLNFTLLSMIWSGWMQWSAEPKRQVVPWRSFRWSVPLSIDYVWNWNFAKAIWTPACSYCAWNSCIQNHSGKLQDFPLFSMIWCGWIQSSAEPKRQVVRWWRFRMVHSAINWLCLKCVYCQSYLDSFMVILHMN